MICKSNGTWCDQQCSLSRHHICESSAYYENQIEALNDLLTSETENLQTKITENSQRIKNISPNQQCYDFPKIANGYVVDTDSKYFYGDEGRVECHKGKILAILDTFGLFGLFWTVLGLFGATFGLF